MCLRWRKWAMAAVCRFRTNLRNNCIVQDNLIYILFFYVHSDLRRAMVVGDVRECVFHRSQFDIVLSWTTAGYIDLLLDHLVPRLLSLGAWHTEPAPRTCGEKPEQGECGAASMHLLLLIRSSGMHIQATIMILVVVVTFAGMWLPLYIIFCTIKLTSAARPPIFDILVPIAQWLGASNSAINPILYSFMHARFRVCAISRI